MTDDGAEYPPPDARLNDRVRQRKVPPQPAPEDSAPIFTDEALALRFAKAHANHLRYVAEWGRWLAFDGVRWHFDTTLFVFDLARKICREAASDCNNKKIAATLASAKTVAAVERLAKADRRLAATVDQWDADAWALTTADATIDLRTGLSRPPSPLDYITKQTACPCAAPGTAHPLWTKFLTRATNSNGELEKFLQRYIGYCCTGFTTEEVFVFAFGTGANGKGTFINTLTGIFSDYATVADMTTFTVTRFEQHPTHLAKLRGPRLVVAQETQKGRRWDETKIKALTGGDPISAHFMRMDDFVFTPTFKLFIGGNHKPRLSNVDEAMRRRLQLVPFTVQIPAAERDEKLKQKLKAEWPAILRWCLDGCREWQHIGLNPPTCVVEATETYFSDQDTIQQWLQDCTQVGGPFAFIRTADLFKSWKAWCEERNANPGSMLALSEALSNRGLEKKRNNKGQQGFSNLTLKPPETFV